MKRFISQQCTGHGRRLARVAAFFLCLLPAALPAELFHFNGKVVGVTDGDTITVLHAYEGKKIQRRVRLWGIDCPEKRGQPWGQKAKEFTSEAVFGKTVHVSVRDIDHFGRLVAVVKAGDQNLSLSLLEAGLAWWYREFAPKEKQLRKAEKAARGDKRGLWADSKPVAPWDWRRREKRKKKGS